MYASVRRGKHRGTSQEIVRRAKDGLLPALSKLPGFISYDIVSLPDNMLLAVTVFDAHASV